MAEYIGKYENAAAIQSAVDGGELVKPYVALDENTGMIDWNTKFIDYVNMPLTLKITSDGDIKMNGRANTTYSINGSEFKYLPNASTTTVNVVAGDVIILKNTDTTYGNLFQNSTAGFVVFGNIQYYKTGTTNDCSSMFNNCTGLTDASNLVLPATTLTQSCYLQMFLNCTSLTKAPQLPATTLANKCYQGMFCYCTSLTTAPELPATTLVSSCYYTMFKGCTSLTTAPVLPATTLTTSCFYQMFSGCTSLNYIKCLATQNLNGNSSYWVNGVAASGTFVKAAGVTWSTGDSGIPSGWTVIEE